VTTSDLATTQPVEAGPSQILTVTQWTSPVATVGLTVLWVLWAATQPGSTSLIVLVLAIAGYIAMLASSRAGTAVPMNYAIALSALALAIVALAPIHHSRDLYLYNSYGRLVSEHDINPFFNAPNSAPGDTTLGFVALRWHQQTSMYGPVFIGLAAFVSSIAGTSELAIRLLWQTVMASAAFTAVLLIARRTNNPIAVLALGCSPVILAAVNDAHNDLLIGLALLGVVLLVEDRRYGLASAIAALAIAIKLTVAFPVLALIAWVLWRRGTRPALQFGVPITAAVTAAYLLVGGISSLKSVQDSAGDDSRFSIWKSLRIQQIDSLQQLGSTRDAAIDAVAQNISRYSLALLLPCIFVVLWQYRRSKHPGEAATIVGLILCTAGAYVMPWYAAMLLPVALLAWTCRATLLLQAQSAFLLVAYANGAGHEPLSRFGQYLERSATLINLVLLTLVLVWARPSEEAAEPGPRFTVKFLERKISTQSSKEATSD